MVSIDEGQNYPMAGFSRTVVMYHQRILGINSDGELTYTYKSGDRAGQTVVWTDPDGTPYKAYLFKEVKNSDLIHTNPDGNKRTRKAKVRDNVVVLLDVVVRFFKKQRIKELQTQKNKSPDRANLLREVGLEDNETTYKLLVWELLDAGDKVTAKAEETTGEEIDITLKGPTGQKVILTSIWRIFKNGEEHLVEILKPGEKHGHI